MKSHDTLKQIVKNNYAAIAADPKKRCCCGTKEPDFTAFSLDYTKKEGYVKDADLKLGCGIPTEYAGIEAGNSLLDLGSGAGNDCFVARSIVGESGAVTGLDFTDEMVEKARKNNQKMGFKNVDFVRGDIEQMPLPDDNFDVVISNCVMNLVPDKVKGFSEIYRVLKPGGHFCISDIVLEGELPDIMRETASLYAGCVSSAIQKDAYLQIISETGFTKVDIKAKRSNNLSDDILLQHVSQKVVDNYRKSGTGIFSITVVGYK
jgi:arsenite methyltransferase